MKNMPELEVSDLSVHYRTSRGSVHALGNIEFRLEAGESIGIAGESACGKSTLGLSVMRMIQGGKIISGKIVFDGESTLDMASSEFDKNIRWKKISMVFQGAMNSLDPVFTIEDQFDEVLKQHKFKGDSDKVIHDAVRSVNLDSSVLKKYPHELSGGMKQRIVIAMALLLKPKFVIADEPTTALDVTVQAQIMYLLSNIQKEFGTSIILITHDLGVVAGNSDDTLVMYGGQVMEIAKTELIYARPTHPYTQGLISAVPRLDDNADKLKTIQGNPPDAMLDPVGCPFSPRCKFSKDICSNQTPELLKTGENNHFRACHVAFEELL